MISVGSGRIDAFRDQLPSVLREPHEEIDLAEFGVSFRGPAYSNLSRPAGATAVRPEVSSLGDRFQPHTTPVEDPVRDLPRDLDVAADDHRFARDHHLNPAQRFDQHPTVRGGNADDLVPLTSDELRKVVHILSRPGTQNHLVHNLKRTEKEQPSKEN